MAGKIWVSDSFLNTSIIAKLSVMPDGLLENPDMAELNRLEAIQKRYGAGETIPTEELYSKAYGNFRETRIGSLPDFFAINGFLLVSAAFADVLTNFNLGSGYLHRMELFQGNRTEAIPGDWFVLVFGCSQAAFLPDRSTGGYKHPEMWPEGRWKIHKPVDRQIAVSASALRQCDLWIDPRLSGAFFMSEGLETALKANKLTRTVRRALCTIVAEN